MSTRNEAELIRALETATGFINEQQRVVKALCVHFAELSLAITPVMLACLDSEVLIQFKADLERINNEVQKAIQHVEETVH